MMDLHDVKTNIILSGNTNEGNIEKIKMLLSTNNIMLFVGSGFSKNALNINGDENMPLAEELALDISTISADFLVKKGNSSPGKDFIDQVRNCKDLRLSSDFYWDNVQNKEDLLDLLKLKFTVKDISDEQINIASFDWRRIYTTNYDNVVELARLKRNKITTSIDLSNCSSNYKSDRNVCLHINGKIDNASLDDLNSKIKLTDSSYLSSNCFNKSEWYSFFKSDLDKCSAIVFIGYSMYDIEISEAIFSDDYIKEKTFFITKDGVGQFNDYKYRKYGSVVNIGVNGFSKLIDEYISSPPTITTDKHLNSFDRYYIQDDTQDIRDKDIRNFLVFGNYENSYIDSDNNIENRMVIRVQVEKIIESIIYGKDVMLTSDIGNGKTITLNILTSKLTKKGYLCYCYNNDNISLKQDIEVLNNTGGNIVIFIDDYDNKIHETLLILKNKDKKIKVILSARHYGYENTIEELNSIDIDNFDFFELDKLIPAEIDQFVNMVDFLGEWGDKAGLSKYEKLKELDDSAKHQLSLLLLSTLKSESIKKKIDDLTRDIFLNKSMKSTTFSILLTDIIGIDINRGIISDICGDNYIYSGDYIKNKDVNILFNIKNGGIKTKSSTLSRFLISNSFEPKYISSALLKIVESLEQKSFSKDDIYSKIVKSLLRFSIVEKVLPQKRNEINFYYEKLKTILPRLINDPHYWVQYAMSFIPFKDFISAQQNLSNAYSYAEKKGDGYHTENIDTQQARLFLLQSLDEKNAKNSFDFFQKADDKIKAIGNNIYKYRQVSLYRDVYQKKYLFFSKSNRFIFKCAVTRIIQEAPINGNTDNKISYSGEIFIKREIEYLIDILDKIKSIDKN